MSLPSHISLSALAKQVNAVISEAFSEKQFWVLTEVTNYSYYAQKGHHYFDLIEKSKNGSDIIAKMQTAAWFTGNERIKRFERLTGQKFKNDIKVPRMCHCRVS
ncbi:MAG: exodeoxyribonuclease VII large subunit [Chitinophagaceae bacterium]